MRPIEEYYKKYADRLMLRVSSPADIPELLEKYPLDKNFIDSIANIGLKIHYDLNCNPNELKGLLSAGLYRIVINSRMDEDEQDLTLVHELIHLALPSIPPDVGRPVYEAEIDKVAKKYAKDKDFMDYIKKTIKTQTS